MLIPLTVRSGRENVSEVVLAFIKLLEAEMATMETAILLYTVD